MKISKFFLSLFFVFVLFILSYPTSVVFAEQNYPLCSSSAKAMCVLEQSSGRVLYGKNIDKKLPMASTTKIFTALTVLENCENLNEIVSVHDNAVGIEGTSIYLRLGEKLTVKELLLGMMLPSGNDAATALAYHVGGNIENFCLMMKNTANNAGAFNSNFKNPHGLDAKDHYTTAYDLAKVSAEALKNPIFYEISTTKSAVISGNIEVKSRYLKNKNRLLKTFDGCNGVKTGFTDNAGRCFVASATRNNMTIVCGVLNCGDMFEECSRLMEKTFNSYKLREILPSYDVVHEINVDGGRETTVKLYHCKSFVYPLTNEEVLKINYIIDVPSSIKAPVIKEQVVGKIKVYLDGLFLYEENVITRDCVKENNLFSYIQDIVDVW